MVRGVVSTKNNTNQVVVFKKTNLKVFTHILEAKLYDHNYIMTIKTLH